MAPHVRYLAKKEAAIVQLIDFRNLQLDPASSSVLAEEMMRRGRNSFDQEIRDVMYFIAGSLPNSSVTNTTFGSLIEEHGAIGSKQTSVVNLSIGAFHEAQLS